MIARLAAWLARLRPAGLVVDGASVTDPETLATLEVSLALERLSRGQAYRVLAAAYSRHVAQAGSQLDQADAAIALAEAARAN